MLTVNPKEISQGAFHAYLLGAVAPRPIAFASTIDKLGNVNLAPFSFFNVFSSNPPILVFSPSRSGRTGLTKHTHDNIKEVPEVVINVVNYDMVNQVSLASTEYPKGTSEFVKAGFTPIASEMVKPFRVKESPAQIECKVNQIIELGMNGGAGNLIICEVLLLHINENVLDDKKHIDPAKIDLVARLGGNWYSRTNKAALFEVTKPIANIGIGIDQIPDFIRNSEILTGNNLGQLGNVDHLPDIETIENYKNSAPIKSIIELNNQNKAEVKKQIHKAAKELLEAGKVHEAWCTLLTFNDEKI